MRTAETDSDKAHTLADFFSSVYMVKDNGDFEYLPMRVPHNQMKMSDVILNCDMKEAKLAKLKTDKSPGLDQLHPRILYELRDIVSYPLLLIFQKSRLQEYFLWIGNWQKLKHSIRRNPNQTEEIIDL